MKTNLRKPLAFILTLALVMCLMPPAFAADVSATGISPTSQSVSVFVGKSAALSVTVTPSDYTGKVNWAVQSGGDYITMPGTTSMKLGSGGVSSITISGKAAGTAVVTASAGSFKSTFTVTVGKDYVSSMVISGDTTTANQISSAALFPGKSLSLHAIETYASSTPASPTTSVDNATWKTSSPDVANVSSTGVVTANSAGSTTITATSKTDTSKSASINVTVTTTPTIRITGEKSTIVVRDTLTLTAESTTSGYTLDAAGLTWSTSDAGVASVSKNSGKATALVSALKDGRATITALYTYMDESNRQQSVSSTYTVTVSGGDITAVSIDPNAYLGLYGSGTLAASFTPTNGTYQSITWISSNPYAVMVSGSSSTASLYGRAEGLSTVTVTVVSTSGKTYTASSQVTVTDLSSTNASDQAIIGSTLTLSNISDMLSAKFVNAYGVVPSSSATITFSSLGSSSYGTLYKSSTSMNIFGKVSSGTAYKYGELAAMAFSPAASGAYSLPYTINDSINGRTMAGTITINVGTNNLAVNVNLGSSSPYLFGSYSNTDGAAASTLIYNAVYAKYAKACDHIVLSTSVSSGSGVGTLYANSAKATVTSSNRTFYYSSSTNAMSGLYFVPAASGTYVRAFTAYDSAGGKIGECELRIIVPDNLISMFYNMKPNASVSIDESLFSNWFQNASGASYLSYVTFDGASSSTGVFSNDGITFQPGAATSFYSSSYSGTVPTSARYIGNVKYKSASSSYSTYVSFTCYGGGTTAATNIVKTGTMVICVTPGSVSAVSYSVKSGTAQPLDSLSFSNVYRTATNTTAASPAFRIQLLGVPSSGSLYYGYVSALSKGTQITGSNCASFDFYANNSSAAYSIDKVTYIPDTVLGNTGLSYAAYSSAGTLLYCGKVVFSTGTGNFDSYSEGRTFTSSDFYSSVGSDPIVSMKFGSPSSGKLFYNYANGRGTGVTGTMRFYTKSSRSGELPISNLTYIPTAGFSGQDIIAYTATTSLGKTQSGSIVVNVKLKTASTRFKDVTAASTGSWSANAIDYCAAWELVSGTGTNAFSPTSTMTRGMLVSVLYKAAGSPAVSGGNGFTDVPSSQYYYKPVLWAYSNGIVSGTTATTFSPNKAVSREQIATILYQYALYSGSDVSSSASLAGYADSGKISSYAVHAMQWAVGSGIVSGTSATTVSPGTSASRAQVAVMLHKYLTA